MLNLKIDKNLLCELIIVRLAEELETATKAAISASQTATDDEFVAKSKYETFGLEASYLARGQAQRVEELRLALSEFERFDPRDFVSGNPIALSALVLLESEAEEDKWVFIAPSGGGQKVEVNGYKIVVVTLQSPLGRALIGKRAGESLVVEFEDNVEHEYEILAVD